MRAFIRQRPWVILVVINVLFVAWWITFVVWASYRAPEYIEPPAAHVRN